MNERPQPTLVQMPVTRIDPPTSNPRHEAKDLDELVESIRGVGILEPLIGVASGNDRVRLVAGLRRYTAGRKVGLARVPMLVYPSLTKRQELAMSLVENLHRKQMSPVEEGEAFLKLCQTGLSQVEVGRMVGLSDYTVSRSIAIATKLCAAGRKAAHDGIITRSFAFDLTQWLPDVQESLLRSRLLNSRREIDSQGNSSIVPNRSKRVGKHRGEVESALRGALTALAGGDRPLAITMTERALEALRQEGALRVVGQ